MANVSIKVRDELSVIGEVLGADAFGFLKVRTFLADLEKFHADSVQAQEVFKAFETVAKICKGLSK